MAVKPERPLWTDERLDDLSQAIRDGFSRSDTAHLAVREDIREMRSEFRSDLGQFKAETHEGFASVDRRIDALQRTLIIGMAGLIASIVAAAATIATIID